MRATTGFPGFGFIRRKLESFGRLDTGDSGGFYAWHPGYWGPHVGFYGGVNYGFGYGGIGFYGGEWRGGAFAYNSAVANFGGVHVTNVYVDRTIVERNTIVNQNHVSFNGGTGISTRPSPMEMQAEHENHFQPTANQMQHETFAGQDRSQLASINHGTPGTPASFEHERLSSGCATTHTFAAHLSCRSHRWKPLQPQHNAKPTRTSESPMDCAADK